MASAFKVGDVVRLKSGGANMTVEIFNSSNAKTMCSWQNKISPENYINCEHTYLADMLELVQIIEEREKAKSFTVNMNLGDDKL